MMRKYLVVGSHTPTSVYSVYILTLFLYLTYARISPFIQEWNDELAYAAQFWAAGCDYMLNEDRNDQIQTYDYIGQSNGATISYTVNYTIMVQTWFQQGRFYNYYSGVCLNADGDEDEEGEACFNYINVSS